MSFKNKVALVTGGSSGIGAAIAAKLVVECAHVIIVDRNTGNFDTISQGCDSNNKNKPLCIVSDITNDQDVKEIVRRTVCRFGKLDILVNNAGIGSKHTSILSSEALQEFDKVIATNLRSIVSLINLLAPLLLKTKGNIINMSSVSALIPSRATGFAYNASKAALDHLTRTIAAELAPTGVRVNGINPGPVKTNIARNSGLVGEKEDELWNTLKNATALKIISDPEEVADLVLFLASDKARGITGASFTIDNGAALRI